MPALLALAGCGDGQSASGGSVHGSAVPLPSGQQTPAAHLHSKISLIEHDPCFSRVSRADVTRCAGRYIAQVGGIADEALRQAPNSPDPGAVRNAARALQKTSGEFQSCHGGAKRCARELSAVQHRLSGLDSVLLQQARSGSSTPPSHG